MRDRPRLRRHQIAQTVRCIVAAEAVIISNLDTLCEAVADTMMVLGSEMWMADLAYYQTAREAAKRGRSGADTIYNDLRTRFPGPFRSPPHRRPGRNPR